jgi:hypothetical protein
MTGYVRSQDDISPAEYGRPLDLSTALIGEERSNLQSMAAPTIFPQTGSNEGRKPGLTRVIDPLKRLPAGVHKIDSPLRADLSSMNRTE